MKGKRRAGEPDDIMQEATRWFVRLHEDPSDRQARPAFEAWRRADVRHGMAYDRLQKLWGASGHLASLVEPDRPDRRALLRGAAGVTVSAAAATVGGTLWLGERPFADYRTRPGEQGSVILNDGSRVEMSTATSLGVRFSAERRRIRVLEGEAWFQVTPDPKRPFSVEAAGGTVTALGTAFAVSADGRAASVSVTEHAVHVEAAGGVASVQEGRRLSYDRNGLGQAGPIDPAALAWRQGQLVFVNEPLGNVVAALDRWTGSRTLVMDADLAAAPVTLIMSTGEARHGLDRLAQARPMRITRTSLVTIFRPK